MSNITTDFITATKKIHADVRAILTALHLIREDVKVIRDQGMDNADKQPRDQQTDASDAKPTDGITCRSNVPDADHANEEHTEREPKAKKLFYDFKQNLWRDLKKPKSYVEFVALVFLVLYTCETRRTNNLTDSALLTNKDQFTKSQTTSKEQFIADQRPYVWVKPGDTTLSADEKMNWEIHYSNYGRSPAIKVRPCIYLEIFYPGRFAGNESRIPPIELQMKSLVSSPPQSFEGCLERWRAMGNTSESPSTSIIPSGFPERSSFASEYKLSGPDVTVMNKTDGHAFVYGTIFYEDVHGNSYMSIFCAYRHHTGVAVYCPIWNEIK